MAKLFGKKKEKDNTEPYFGGAPWSQSADNYKTTLENLNKAYIYATDNKNTELLKQLEALNALRDQLKDNYNAIDVGIGAGKDIKQYQENFNVANKAWGELAPQVDEIMKQVSKEAEKGKAKMAKKNTVPTEVKPEVKETPEKTDTEQPKAEESVATEEKAPEKTLEERAAEEMKAAERDAKKALREKEAAERKAEREKKAADRKATRRNNIINRETEKGNIVIEVDEVPEGINPKYIRKSGDTYIMSVPTNIEFMSEASAQKYADLQTENAEKDKQISKLNEDLKKAMDDKDTARVTELENELKALKTAKDNNLVKLSELADINNKMRERDEENRKLYEDAADRYTQKLETRKDAAELAKFLPTFVGSAYRAGEFGDPKSHRAKATAAYFILDRLANSIVNAGLVARGMSPTGKDEWANYSEKLMDKAVERDSAHREDILKKENEFINKVFDKSVNDSAETLKNYKDEISSIYKKYAENIDDAMFMKFLNDNAKYLAGLSEKERQYMIMWGAMQSSDIKDKALASNIENIKNKVDLVNTTNVEERKQMLQKTLKSELENRLSTKQLRQMDEIIEGLELNNQLTTQQVDEIKVRIEKLQVDVARAKQDKEFAFWNGLVGIFGEVLGLPAKTLAPLFKSKK